MHGAILSLALFLAVFGLILFFNASPALGQKHLFQVVKIYRPLTQKLPSIDRVELLKLEEHADLRSGGIISIKTLKGIKAKNLASLWRSQKYGPGLSACHIRFMELNFIPDGNL